MDICVVKKKAKLYGLAKGKAAGFADGKAAGFADGIKEIAKALKENGMDIHEISKITGLSLKELKYL